MKIKTLWIVNNAHFDEKVNQLLEEGWHLAKRDVFIDAKNLDDSVFYAELVLGDPKEQSERLLRGPLNSVIGIKALCAATSNEDCIDDRCPLSGWCTRMVDATERNWVTPDNWEIPEKEAPEA